MMPISALGHYRKVYGFTLLELMVVMIVIGISLSLVIPKLMKNDDDVLKDESKRLGALIEYAADSASSRGVWLAWSPTAFGYHFLQRDDDKNIWQPVLADEVLRERRLPEGMHLNAISQQQVEVAVDGLIAFSPSGIQVPFNINLSIGDKKCLVSGNLLGKVKVSKSDLDSVKTF